MQNLGPEGIQNENFQNLGGGGAMICSCILTS